MNSMSPGNNMKPQFTVNITASAAAYTVAATQAAKDSVDTHPTIAFNLDMIAQLVWAKKQGFTFRGHTLVWHNQTPAEFFRSGYTATGTPLNKVQMTARMDFYIREIIRLLHEGWPGMVSAIDVVNEAIDDNTGAVRTSGNSWWTAFGDETYIMKAFELTRKYTLQYGETQIRLYYNDYSTHVAKKADGIVRLVTPIFQAGLLDGLGMQEHDNNSTPIAADWIATYNKFYLVCNEMSVTEFDVATGNTNSPSAAVLATQANQYGQMFKSFVERSYKSGRGKIINVSKDGLNDANTFQANTASSLWDGLNKCKPAFYAVANIGLNFNVLDSLIKYGDQLQSNTYTSDSWSKFSTKLTQAKTARGQAYSASVSADTSLNVATVDLKGAITTLVNVAAAADRDAESPRVFALKQNYPNPFNPNTIISYRLPATSAVTLKIHDVLGREVVTLVNEKKSAGEYQATWNASQFPSGVYLYTLNAGVFWQTRPMVLQK
jgi:GH35 family endo-1,4-beta-xylanase